MEPLSFPLEVWQYGTLGGAVVLLTASLWLRIRARRAKEIEKAATLEVAVKFHSGKRSEKSTIKVSKVETKPAASGGRSARRAARRAAKRAKAASIAAVKAENAAKAAAVKAEALAAEARRAEATANTGASAKLGSPTKAELAKAEAVAEQAKAEAAQAATVAEAAKAGAEKLAKGSVEMSKVAKVASSPRTLVIFAGEAHTALLCGVLTAPHVCAKNREEFLKATKQKGAVAFVDVDLLFQLKGERPSAPVIGMIDEKPAEALSKTIRTLDSFPWLSQIITTTMLSSPDARTSLDAMLGRLLEGPGLAVLGASGVGRVALLAQSSHRDARFERIEEFFSKHGLSTKAITTINEVSEELVMNALYNAPTEAGYFKEPISRSVDVTLPPERACEISYGIDEGTAFVRVRDTFGALTRTRLLEVLSRCNSKAVELDESRGGAGLGLWRIFSTATSVSITVIPGHLTDFLVKLSTANGRVVKKLQGVHLFFAPEPEADESFDSLIPDDQDLMDQSITLVIASA